jgi:tetratricopeptide (TPR) repeat protein
VNLAAGAKEPAIAFAQASRDKPISAYSRAFIDLALGVAAGDRERQCKALERLTTLRPGEYEFQARLGSTLAMLGRWQPAVESYRRAVEAAPYEAGLWNEFGYVLQWAGRTDEALRALNEYAKLEPASANPQDSQGEVALMAGRFGEAIQRFEESYRKDPKFNGGEALEKAGYAAYLEGSKARAGSYINRYLGVLGDAAKPANRLIRARWHMAFGDVPAAVESFEELDPAAAAQEAASAGDWDEAGRLLKAKPAVGAPGLRLVVDGEGRFPGRAAEMPELASARGVSAALRGRWSEATDEFAKALRQVPTNTPQAGLLREASAWVLVMQKKPGEAAKLLGPQWPMPMPAGFSEVALLVYPNLFYTRAEISLSQGKKDEARKLYDQFLQYTGSRKDNFGMIVRSRAASRL